MPVSDSTFIKDMLRFTERSLSWCAKESEKETMRISEAVDLIYADLKKRSNLSNESLSALESFLKERGEISEPTDGHGSGSEKQMKLMMKDLSKLGDKDRDLARFINPVVENLQFQDSLRQNLGNMFRMLEVWNEEREKLALKSELTQQDLVSLGEKVLECMTSQDERNIVRSQITGLPEEKKQTGVMEF